MSRPKSGRESHKLHARTRRSIARGEIPPPKIETSLEQAIQIAGLP